VSFRQMRWSSTTTAAGSSRNSMRAKNRSIRAVDEEIALSSKRVRTSGRGLATLLVARNVPLAASSSPASDRRSFGDALYQKNGRENRLVDWNREERTGQSAAYRCFARRRAR